MPTIERVVFMQDDDADKVLDRLCRVEDWVVANGATDETIAETIAYLAQWHNPGEHETSDQTSSGSSDEMVERDGYILSWNLGLGYVGLEYRVDA